ncbi:1-acyl-sn-glycerol-3-phosphate acyltransferase [Nostoc sphaeroides CHAB 2801]|uniref:lysophospholipid acyltransferase family protein n=1 Tax=Nostoc sphaeroides TaxID=446679 RepID=UPI0015F33AD0|nr:1-acyl-sn-glycerol-3-phosphate acyltransferase [Nostoc sphaeroides]MCC5629903.1 1-acyl-sn-glycerol-3-phosphate acyltransferase [Nostoc sphaeroides CHAB 2801]
MMEFYSSSDTCQQTPANHQVAGTTSRVSPWLSPLAYLLGRHCLLPLFFGQISITGQKNIPTTGPVIFAPTHRARWDALVVPYATSDCRREQDLRFMVTIDECQGLQGWFVRRLGGFAVNSKHPSIRTLRHGVELLQQQKTLVIFPEGNIFRDGQVHQLKPGIARLALSAESSHSGLGVKIIPIGINYSQPYPNWGTDVSIDIGSPIKVADYMSGCIKQDAKSITADLAKALQQLSHQETKITNHAFAEITNS